MDYSLLIEWIGYIGSVIIAVSLTMSSIVKLRWLNLLGAVIFSTYGFIIGSLPVALLNLFISLINTWYLFKIYNQKDFLKILHISPENKYLEFFIDYYHDDINTFFPGFYESYKNQKSDPASFCCYLVIRNAAVAGIFITRRINDSELFVEIDFTIPEYRDLKSGKYIYMQNQLYFQNMGIKFFSAAPRNDKHYEYLKKMGFAEKKGKDNIVYMVRNVA
jgi:hypothetical protein